MSFERIIPFFFILLLLGSCKDDYKKNKEKELFDWEAYTSSPKFRGPSYCTVTFFYKGNGIAGYSFCLGDGPGWENTGGGSMSGERYKPVPDSMAIQFICTLDLIRYSGGWKLPRTKMLNLFNNETKSNNKEGSNDYSSIVAGVAPGGTVTVWMQNGSISKEIVKFKAKPTKFYTRGTEEDKSRPCASGYFVDDKLDDFYIYNYLHPIPYTIWTHNEKLYNADFAFCFEGGKNYSAVVHEAYSKDGTIYRSLFNGIQNEVEWGIPSGKPNPGKKMKLPEQIDFQFYSKILGENNFHAEIVLPQNFEEQFTKGYKDPTNGKQRHFNRIVLAVEQGSAQYDKYAYGVVQLDGINKRQAIMRFRMVKEDTLHDNYDNTRYSLPKGFVFKEWNGRLPIKKLDFAYWQEK